MAAATTRMTIDELEATVIRLRQGERTQEVKTALTKERRQQFATDRAYLVLALIADLLDSREFEVR